MTGHLNKGTPEETEYDLPEPYGSIDVYVYPVGKRIRSGWRGLQVKADEPQFWQATTMGYEFIQQAPQMHIAVRKLIQGLKKLKKMQVKQQHNIIQLRSEQEFKSLWLQHNKSVAGR